jgi:hypothetical protein
LLAACCATSLACGKYGPPVRVEQKPEPVQHDEQEQTEATP